MRESNIQAWWIENFECVRFSQLGHGDAERGSTPFWLVEVGEGTNTKYFQTCFETGRKEWKTR